MAAIGTEILLETTSAAQSSTPDGLADSLAKTILQDEASQTEPGDNKKTTLVSPPMIYTRPQILFLHSSPLVKPPPNMPELKDWFGSDNDQGIAKRDAEATTPSSARRFRRDTEDGDTPSRPTFRSTLSQPSQMGNFKHQSLRTGDRDRERDRERDGDKDRERDIRDKEGQERLRHLSDKYDRDRLALPLVGLRSKDRDAAPHLVAGSTSRLGVPSQLPSVASRRAETREASKKKAGETSEDWRRGAEPRSARDERPDNGRKDRDERERPRSRARDSSRPKRDTSNSRRDRDREDKDRDRVRGERDRDDPRRDRDRDEFRRERERDPDREFDSEDPRRWKDDGKRDERMATRRSDRHPDYRDRDRARERGSHDPTWDTSADRRWTVVEERDGRSKRTGGRDRKTGPAGEDVKDRDERRDRDREKEKEPAWMDTYIPSTTGAGILGGKSLDGELDGIQAWKKGMKEKEQKEQNFSTLNENGAEVKQATIAEKPDANGKQLDEIQLFRLLMKREEEKKTVDHPRLNSPSEPAVTVAAVTDKIVASTTTSRQAQVSVKPIDNAIKTKHESLTSPFIQSNTDHPQTLHMKPSISTPPRLEQPPSAEADHHPLLSLLGSKDFPIAPTISSSTPLDVPLERSKTPTSSWATTNPISPENPPQNLDRPSFDSAPGQFNPPSGSRLLAFARAPSVSARPAVSTSQNGGSQNAGASQLDSSLYQGSSKPDSVRSLSGFSPFEDQTRSAYGSEEVRELGSSASPSDAYRRGSAERSSSILTSEHGSFQDVSPPFDNNSGFSVGKGSRFAKFFDGKGKDGAPAIPKVQTPVGYASPSPNLSQRQEHSSFISGPGGPTDQRAMDDIYAMLNSSTQQGQRATPGNIPSSALLANVPFGQQAHSNLHLLQQQQLHNHHSHNQMHSNRLEPLYESHLDDRNFMPDGMVPGLRSAAPRNRENIGMYPDALEDSMHYNIQRLPPQQQRGLEPLYPGPLPPMYSQQVGRNTGIPLQQPHYRGGPSPNQQNSLQSSQRLPPGLANLGGRPPHEPSQFLGMAGMPSPGLHGSLHLNGSPQQPFNNFPSGNNLGYPGGPQIRAPHQLQNPVPHHPLGHPNNMDLRNSGQSQLLGMGGVGLGVLRGTGGGFTTQPGPNAQMQGPLLAMRQQQQQQQQLLPHMMPHFPPHLQQQQGLPAPNNQPTHDLMALLMGGSHRE